MIVKSKTIPDGFVKLPYTVKIEKPDAKIGIFGDSFAQLAEFYFHPKSKNYNHEVSWIYFLANIINMECDTYGVSNCSMGDIFYTLLKTKKNYDYYIIMCTNPTRPNIFSDIQFKASSCKIVKNFLEDKKVIFVYWDSKHIIYDFEKPFIINKFHLTNPNKKANFDVLNKTDAIPNKLDLLDGDHHMSGRGNLLFALDISKLLFATYLKN